MGGNREAYAELVSRHHQRVYGLCLSLLSNPAEAEDAAQETFVKAFRSLNRFQGKSQFSTWLFRIAYNHCKEIQRRSFARPIESLDVLIEQRGEALEKMFNAPHPDSGENADLAKRLLARLPENYRNVLLLRESHGLNYGEVAETLGVSLDAVKARLRRARQNLVEIARHFLPPGSV